MTWIYQYPGDSTAEKCLLFSNFLKDARNRGEQAWRDEPGLLPTADGRNRQT